MTRSRRRPAPSDWRALASLGEQLVGDDSLLDQRDRIKRMTGRIIPGQVDVWLQERLFRLPGRNPGRTFPSQPRSAVMREAITRGELHRQSLTNSKGGEGTSIAIPIEDQGLLLGAIQVTRRTAAFAPEEIETLQAIESVVAVGLYARYRVEVERFRREELNLVRRVSAEIANVMRLDELSRRVCDLIREAFQYYYVAIFTLKPGEKKLRFRSSSSKGSKAGRGQPLALEVDLGQGLIGEAAASGKVISAEDVTRDARYRFIEPLPATRSEVVIPLMLEGRVLGVLDVQSDQTEAFHSNDMLLLEALADNIARAVEGARLYGDLERRADQFALVAEVSRRVASSLDLVEMLGQTARLIHDRLGFAHVALFTVHPMRRVIVYEAGSGKRADALRGHTIPLDEAHGMIPWAAREGRAILSNDVSREPRFRPSPLPPRNTRSELTIPLLFGKDVLGVLDIQSEKINAFSDDDRLMFEAVAGTIAASIRNADLYRSEQWRRQVADSLSQVAGLISENAGTDAVLEAVLTELERNLPVERAVIWLTRGNELYPAAVHGLGPSGISRLEDRAQDAGSLLRGITGRGLATIRKSTDGEWPIGRAPGLSAEYSGLAAPLHVGEQTVGMITIAHHERGRYGHEAQTMVATFASYAAVAIENARLYDDAQEQGYASAALLQVAETVAGPLGIEDTLHTVLRSMPILLGVRSVALYAWDSGRALYVRRSTYGTSDETSTDAWPAEVADGSFPLADAVRRGGLLALHVLRGQPVSGPRTRLSPARRPENALHDPAPLLLAMPVIIKGDLLAVLLVEEGGVPARYRGRRLGIIQGISQQIALAIQNDLLQEQMVARERLETEAQLARQIQKTFVPEQLPSISGWELAARWQTARQVGGDFYDVVRTARGQIGFFVADVADKGMPAALIMALTRTLFRAALAEGDSPAKVLKTVNDLLAPDTRQGMFVTAFYAVLNPVTGEVVYANAGHNPPMWSRQGEVVRPLRRTAMALGIIEGLDVEEQRISLVSGDALLLYTDGVTEAFGINGEIYGEDRLGLIVQEASAGSAESLLNAIQSDLDAFTGGAPLPDDLTMVAVRRT